MVISRHAKKCLVSISPFSLPPHTTGQKKKTPLHKPMHTHTPPFVVFYKADFSNLLATFVRKGKNRMFHGTADQFHRLIASRTEASSPSPLHLPLTFTHLASTAPPSTTNTIATTIFPGFDLYPTSHQLQHDLDIQQPIAQFLHPLHHHQLHPTTPSHRTHEEEEKVDEDALACIKLPPPPGGEDRPWTDDEVLALLRIRSGMENWFPEVSWEHVSRKLEELGFKRSPEKCKEKFEEGSSRFYDNNNNDEDENNHGKNNFRILSELEQICQGDSGLIDEDEMEDCPEVEESETFGIQALGENRDCKAKEGLRSKGRTKRKRRQRKFKMFKRFCEEAVEKLMIQQEEMHNKLLQDLVKRDEEMVTREEERKKQEMDRINKELDVRKSEQAIAGNRQATVIELLTKFTSSISDDKILLCADNPSEGTDIQTLTSIPSNMCGASMGGWPATTELSNLYRKNKDTENDAVSISDTQIHQAAEGSAPGSKDENPNFPSSHHKNPGSPSVAGATKLNNRETCNKRWPREEVEALINLRCDIDNRRKPEHSGSQREAPQWERISRGMMELGYKRSAKRCKEKWENVNKYFRKTKDVRKKRSSESRTCPYFQQLSSLYGGGTTTAQGCAEGDKGR